MRVCFGREKEERGEESGKGRFFFSLYLLILHEAVTIFYQHDTYFSK